MLIFEVELLSHNVRLHRAEDREQFIFFLCGRAELVECRHKVAHHGIEFSAYPGFFLSV